MQLNEFEDTEMTIQLRGGATYHPGTLYPQSVIRITQCCTAVSNPNDRFALISQSELPERNDVAIACFDVILDNVA